MKLRLLLFNIFFLSNIALPAPLSDAVGQMMMVGFNGTTVNENSPIVYAIKNYHIGGVILDNHRDPHTRSIFTNIENPTQLKKLIASLQFFAKKYHDYPLFITVNQEGGVVNTLKNSQGFNNANDPSEFELGQKSSKIIFDETLKRALLLKQIGINLNLAPVADLNINPENPAIGKLQRSFGSNPQKVTDDLESAIRAYKKANIFCTLKHFPGLGSATKNTDYDKADLTLTWKKEELLPYQNLIRANKTCEFIMVGHLINKNLDKTGLPASLSHKIISDHLIDKMGYKGLIITDDMDAIAIRKNFSTQDAIQKAVLAGNNMIIYGGTQGNDPEQDATMLFNTLTNLAEKNSEVRQKIYKSYQKIIKTKQLSLK